MSDCLPGAAPTCDLALSGMGPPMAELEKDQDREAQAPHKTAKKFPLDVRGKARGSAHKGPARPAGSVGVRGRASDGATSLLPNGVGDVDALVLVIPDLGAVQTGSGNRYGVPRLTVPD
jgi:hypothetical protein